MDAAPTVAALSTLSFLEAVAQEVGIPERAQALARMVRVVTLGDGRLVRLRVHHTSPALAQRLNGALVQAFIAQVAAQVQRTREAAEARLREVDAQLAETSQILQQSRAALAGLAELFASTI